MATRLWAPWTTEENTLLLRPDVSSTDAAVLLGRTLPAVGHQRRRLRERLNLPEPIRAAAIPKKKYFPEPAAPAGVAS